MAFLERLYSITNAQEMHNGVKKYLVVRNVQKCQGNAVFLDLDFSEVLGNVQEMRKKRGRNQ